MSFVSQKVYCEHLRSFSTKIFAVSHWSSGRWHLWHHFWDSLGTSLGCYVTILSLSKFNFVAPFESPQKNMLTVSHNVVAITENKQIFRWEIELLKKTDNKRFAINNYKEQERNYFVKWWLLLNIYVLLSLVFTVLKK